MQPQSKTGLNGKIVEWDRQKGFGWVQAGKHRVFLHRRDFAEHHKRPEVGDAIRFHIGKDARGRTCATKSVHVDGGGHITILDVIVTVALLVLPMTALQRHGVGLLWVGAYMILTSLFAIWGGYAVDKRRAQAKEWRVSEGQLHLLEFLGGWPGAFLAQRRYRHKCSKSSYQFMFWLIVFAYQFAAFDSLQNWRLSRKISAQLAAESKSRR